MIPRRDDPQFLAMEARLAAAAREIETVMDEAEKLWPDSKRRWVARFIAGMPDKSYLFHELVPEICEDDND